MQSAYGPAVDCRDERRDGEWSDDEPFANNEATACLISRQTLQLVHDVYST